MSLNAAELHEAGQPFIFAWSVDPFDCNSFAFTVMVDIFNAARLHGRTQIACDISDSGHRDKTIDHVRTVATHVAQDGETFEVAASGTDDDWESFVITLTHRPNPPAIAG